MNRSSILSVLILLVVASLAQAKVTRHPAVGEIHFDKSTIGGKMSNGQCGLIGVDLIITAFHVIDHRDIGSGIKRSVWISFNGAEPIRADYIAGNFEDDIALMRLEKGVDITPLKVAGENAKVGDEIFLEAANHRESQHVPMVCDPLTSGDIVSGDIHCWQGESGTVFLNQAGEIVGILTGGWQICKDENGKHISRAPNGVLGPITHKVYPTSSRSTADEIRSFIDAQMTKVISSRSGDQERESGHSKSEGIIREYRAGMLKRKGCHLLVLSAPWCNPCQRLKADLDRWEEDLKEAGWDSIIIVDADKNKGMRDLYRVKVYPTVVKIVDGKIVKRWEGVPSKSVLLKEGR